jgi:hypothetical protein
MPQDFSEPNNFTKPSDSDQAADPSSATGMFAAVNPDWGGAHASSASNFMDEFVGAEPVGGAKATGVAESGMVAQERAMPVVRELIIRPAAGAQIDKPFGQSPSRPTDPANAGEFTRILQTLRQPAAAATGLEPVDINIPQKRDRSEAGAQSFTELFQSVSLPRSAYPAESQGPQPFGLEGGTAAASARPGSEVQKPGDGAGSFTQFLDSLAKPPEAEAGELHAEMPQPRAVTPRQTTAAPPVSAIPNDKVSGQRETLKPRLAVQEDATRIFGASTFPPPRQTETSDLFRQPSPLLPASNFEPAGGSLEPRRSGQTREPEPAKREPAAEISKRHDYVPGLLIFNTLLLLVVLVLLVMVLLHR